MFISTNATESVNVDSKARKSVELNLKTGPSTRVFALAEKQVWHFTIFALNSFFFIVRSKQFSNILFFLCRFII